MKDKLSIIFWPFVFVSIGLLTLYSAFHWLLIIQLKLLTLPQDLIMIGLPLGFSLVIAYFWLGTRMSILKIATTNWNGFRFILFFATFTLALPLCISQNYLSSATGKLTSLPNIEHLNTESLTKYYTFDSIFFDFKNTVGMPHWSIDEDDNKLLMNLYFVVPILATQTSTSHVNAWLGIAAFKRVNLGNEEQNNQAFSEFHSQTLKRLNNGDYTSHTFLERVEIDAGTQQWRDALSKNGDVDAEAAQFFKVHTTPYAERNGNMLKFIVLSYLILMSLFLVLLLPLKIDSKALRAYKAGKLENEYEDFFEFLTFRTEYYITPIIMYLNIGVFVCMAIKGVGFLSFASKDLVTWGGNLGTLSLSGEWWRLFSCMFLHSGLPHLLANMYGLAFVGLILEPLFCNTRMVITYIVGGLIGSIISAYWSGDVVSVGASGAICALYGACISLAYLRVLPISRAENKGFLISILIFAAFSVIPGFFTPHVDNAGHVGGLIGGMFVAALLSIGLPVQEDKQDSKMHPSS